MFNEQAKTTTIFFLTGVAVGAAVALLFAPQSGRRTRRAILRTMEDAQESLKEAGRDLADESRRLYRRGREKATGAAREIAEDTAAVVERIRHATA